MAKVIITNLNTIVDASAASYIAGNVSAFKSTIPGPTGPKGSTGDTGEDGTNVVVTSVLNNVNKSITINFSDGTTHTTDPLKGQDGTSITISNVVNNVNGTLTISFSDGTSHTTQDLTGPRGFKGDTGDHVHHISYTRSKDALGNEIGAVTPGNPGTDDIYSMWTSQEELPEMFIGEFLVHNGMDTLTIEDQYKLNSIEEGAEVNVSTDWNATSGDAELLNKPTTISGYGITNAYTKTEVDTAISNVVDSAPATLDTLNELAAALGDDSNFATTTATALGNRVVKNADIVAGSNTKITYDSKGLVTAGTTPVTLAGYSISDAYTKTEADLLLDTKAEINDDTPSLTEVYSSTKTQYMHNLQAEAIANLATAQCHIINSSTPALTLTTTHSVLPFAIHVDSTDTNIMTVNDAANTITFLKNASFNFLSHVLFSSTTYSARTVSFELINTDDNSVLVVESNVIDIPSGTTEGIALNTLITVGRNGIPEAPLTMTIRAYSTGTGHIIQSFNSILASSSSYDVSTEAAGISFVPAGNIAALNVQLALQELDSEKLASISYTPADVLTKIKTVDGTGSGLDADLLDGQHGAYYATAASVSALAALDPTITLNGDLSGSGTMTNLGNVTITATVVDDSHNHIISNVDGLQTALDGKLPLIGGTITGDVLLTSTDTTSRILSVGKSSNGSQGTGAIEVTQDGLHGGGISYNGDGTPAFVSGETADNVTFYRMNAGTRSEVFSYSALSDDVTFNGGIIAPTVTASIVGNAATATKLSSVRTFALTGDVTGTITSDLTSGVSIATTIAANSVALGTDTTGNYVAGATAGTGMVISGTAGEGWSPTITLSNVGTVGTYRSVTTDAQGRVTAGTNPTTVAGYGLTDVYTKTEIDTNIGTLAEFTTALG